MEELFKLELSKILKHFLKKLNFNFSFKRKFITMLELSLIEKGKCFCRQSYDIVASIVKGSENHCNF